MPQLARHGIALRDDRAKAVDLIAERFAHIAAELGLEGAAELRYKPRSRAATPEELAAELAEPAAAAVGPATNDGITQISRRAIIDSERSDDDAQRGGVAG